MHVNEQAAPIDQNRTGTSVLLVGGGGREHALAWKLCASPLLARLYCSPGNPGMTALARCSTVSLEGTDAIVDFARRQKIGLVVIGPEQPLVEGLADLLRAAGIPVFGPSAAAARLEGSKGFMKDILKKAGVPTARYARFCDIEAAAAFIRAHPVPVVVKTDGLAAGKGVVIARTQIEAIEAARGMLSGASFGAAGREIVIEEFLEGEEVSFFALCDGRTVVPLDSVRDHKRAFDGDTGPNTGGMGTISPAPGLSPETQQQVMLDCLVPTLAAMEAAGAPYTGVLFCGLMLTPEGPKVLEYNIRFGDPECQALMLRLDSDLLPLLLLAAQGRLHEAPPPQWSRSHAACIVIAAKGYPGHYETSRPIGNIAAAAEAAADVMIFHAATRMDPDSGAILSHGGRVLNICATGPTLAQAVERAYAAADRLDWPDGFFRRDIGRTGGHENAAQQKKGKRS